jgi:small-conductance mechanosensitive channel
MDGAQSALREALAQLTSLPVLIGVVAVAIAGIVAIGVARALRVRRADVAAVRTPHLLDHALEAAILIAPVIAALALLGAAHVVVGRMGLPVQGIDGAARLLVALIVVRLGVFALGVMLGPASWVRTRESRITLILWLIVAVAALGWLDVIEASLNRISLLPGRSQLSLWAVLKGLVIVTAFVVVTSLIARAIERHVMRLDQLAVSTRVGVSKFTYFLLVGLGVMLGINAAGVDVTTLNVLTGAIGLGLGFGLQAVASNFVSGFVLLMDKSIKPGDWFSTCRPRQISTRVFNGFSQA